jgi:hypothetical protein
MVSRPVCLGIRHTSKAHDDVLISTPERGGPGTHIHIPMEEVGLPGWGSLEFETVSQRRRRTSTNRQLSVLGHKPPNMLVYRLSYLGSKTQ